MERLRTKPIIVDNSIINRYNSDQFSTERIFKGLNIKSEYNIDGCWTSDKPTKKPDRKRFLFEAIEDFRVAKDAYFIWQHLSHLKPCQEKPEFPETILARILQARTRGQELILFTPWGVRAAGEPIAEIAVMNKLQEIKKMLKEKGVSAEVLIMPADLYATEINSIDKITSMKYFGYIRSLAETKGFVVKSWSDIRSENYLQYNERSLELTQEEIDRILNYGVIIRAKDSARRRSGFTDPSEIENSAYAYLRERICEAEIIDNIYQPIKISAGSKNKDSGVDRNLPRLYVFPENLQFPWLK